MFVCEQLAIKSYFDFIDAFAIIALVYVTVCEVSRRVLVVLSHETSETVH